MDRTISVMDRTIARLNIERYQRLLAEEVDEKRRQVLLRLVAEEETKLGKRGQPAEAPVKP